MGQHEGTAQPPVGRGVGGPVPLPAYGGSADTGVEQSVDTGSGAAGDLVQVLDAEHRKLERLFAEVEQLLDARDLEGLRRRWGGIVRELLEHETAEEHVVWPLVRGPHGPENEDLAAEHARQEGLRARLLDHDALNPDVEPTAVREILQLAREHLRGKDAALLPVVSRLPADQLRTLGEDFRQVKG